MTSYTGTITCLCFFKLKRSVTTPFLQEINWILNKRRPRVNAARESRNI